MRERIAHACFTIAAGAFAVAALLYLFRSEFMPYHAAAVGKSWGQLDPGQQTLLLALMRVAGGGWLATSVALGLMVRFSLRQGQAWGRWAIPLVGICSAAPTLWATLLVKFNTPGLPPWYVPAAIIALLLIGLVISLGSKNRVQT